MKRPFRTLDFCLSIALAAATIAYLRTWPQDFLQADEGTFLYEATRVLDGDVIYRDFFEVIMPTSIYVLAGVFAVFGTSIETARAAMSVVHAGIVIMLFQVCRAFGVRRTIAIAVALAHVAIAYPALTITTPHWLGTLLTLVILYRAVTTPWPPTTGTCVSLGVLAGVLFIVQHQRGVVTGLGLAVLLGAYGIAQRHPVQQIVKRLGLLTAGAAAVVVPALVLIILAAGAAPVFDALVVHPLTHYRSYHNRTWWGQYHTGWVYSRYYVYPELIRWLPAVIPLAVAAVAWRIIRGTAIPATNQLAVSACIAATAVAAVAYNPDLVHLAFVAPFCFILAAVMAHALLEALQRLVPHSGLLADALAMLLSVWLVQQAQHNVGERRYYHPYPHETAFGHIDYRFAPELELVDAVRTAASQAKNRELFCYTACAGLYLTSGTKNATPYQLMIPGYNRPDQLDHVVEILEARQVELVVSIPTGIKQAGIRDPINTYLRAKYRVMPISAKPSLTHRLWQRLPAEAPKSPG